MTDISRIKICGLTRREDISFINQMMPEYMGFVFFEKSIRYITPEKASELKKLLNPSIRAVGVFLDNEMELVKELSRHNIIDMIQLHGDSMGEDFIKELKEFTDKPIIRAFSVKSEEDIRLAEESIADYVLLDSGKGGTGTNFDWNLINDIKRPYFLAGGLSPENVREAVLRFKPFAVDVSSGVETEKRKDYGKIRQFIEEVRKVQ